MAFGSFMDFERVIQQKFGELAPEVRQKAAATPIQVIPSVSSRFEQQLKQSNELKGIKFTPTYSKGPRPRSFERPVKQQDGRSLDVVMQF